MSYSSFHYPPNLVHNRTEPHWLPQHQFSLTNGPSESSLDTVEHAEQLYVEQIRSTLLNRPEPPSAGAPLNHMTSLIYPVVGISQQSQTKLISDVISQFNEELDGVSLASIRGGEMDGESSSAEGASSNDSSTLSRMEKYCTEFENLLQLPFGRIAADGQRKANHSEPPKQENMSKGENHTRGRLSTSSSMMSINSNSSGSLEDLNLDNSNSF